MSDKIINGNKVNDRKEPFNWLQSVVAPLILTALAICDFTADPDRLSLTWEILTLLGLSSLLILAPSFDKLSLGKLLTVEKHMKDEKEKRVHAEERADHLSQQLVSLSTSISTRSEASPTINIQNAPQAGAASEIEAAQNDEEKEAVLNSPSGTDEDSTEPSSAKIKKVYAGPSRISKLNYAKIEQLAIKSLAKKWELSERQFAREIKLYEPEITHRVSVSPVIFDALVIKEGMDTFIEVAPLRSGRSIFPFHFRERLHRQLSLLREYNRSRDAKARMVFIIAYIKRDSTKNTSEKSVDWLSKIFEPAISNGLLKIEVLEINEADVLKANDDS